MFVASSVAGVNKKLLHGGRARPPTCVKNAKVSRNLTKLVINLKVVNGDDYSLCYLATIHSKQVRVD